MFLSAFAYHYVLLPLRNQNATITRPKGTHHTTLTRIIACAFINNSPHNSHYVIHYSVTIFLLHHAPYLFTCANNAQVHQLYTCTRHILISIRCSIISTLNINICIANSTVNNCNHQTIGYNIYLSSCMIIISLSLSLSLSLLPLSLALPFHSLPVCIAHLTTYAALSSIIKYFIVGNHFFSDVHFF